MFPGDFFPTEEIPTTDIVNSKPTIEGLTALFGAPAKKRKSWIGCAYTVDESDVLTAAFLVKAIKGVYVAAPMPLAVAAE